MKNRKVGYLYIFPWLIGVLFLTVYPFLNALYISFTDYNMVAKAGFVGFNNYIVLFKDKNFITSLKATLKYTIYTVPLQLTFALFIAFILNFNLKAIGFFRTAYYVPSLLGGNVAIAILWRFMFQPDGFVNHCLMAVHLEPVTWFSSPGGAMTVVVLLKVWQFGSAMLIFLAALKEIPQDLYEAASIDGSGKARTFFSITIPLITPTIFFNLIMQMVNAFQEFNGPFLITGKGPLNATYLSSMFIYDYAFKYFNMGYASAASWVLFLLIMLVTFILFGTQKFWVYYSDEGDK